MEAIEELQRHERQLWLYRLYNIMLLLMLAGNVCFYALQADNNVPASFFYHNGLKYLYLLFPLSVILKGVSKICDRQAKYYNHLLEKQVPNGKKGLSIVQLEEISYYNSTAQLYRKIARRLFYISCMALLFGLGCPMVYVLWG
ncbi:hypothetical protein OOZ15_13395 [Galbibacter sp. EGI 63066]|uniref:hypothetical protein n=1 Tax=Galbibacter sp. EGI 63066 TaxID=2993559 RepID=UPI002248FA00|nr:hypothetical protein [Galbibacter sp. EGI 63066]MCX2680942.1 hypothetical protein [Galbibacter sp. EGI 63066]